MGMTSMRQRDVQKPRGPLSPREYEILNLVAVGQSSAEMATTLGIKKRTIEEFVQNCIRKLGANNRPHAVAIGYQQGILSLSPPTAPEHDAPGSAESKVEEPLAS